LWTPEAANRRSLVSHSQHGEDCNGGPKEFYLNLVEGQIFIVVCDSAVTGVGYSHSAIAQEPRSSYATPRIYSAKYQ
jgi:hypothetical protein